MTTRFSESRTWCGLFMLLVGFLLLPNVLISAILPVPSQDENGIWHSPGGILEERNRSINVTLRTTGAEVEIRQMWFNATRNPIRATAALPLPLGSRLVSSTPTLRQQESSSLDIALDVALQSGFPHLLRNGNDTLWFSENRIIEPHRHWGVTVRFTVPPVRVGKQLIYTIPFADQGPPTAPIRRVSVSARTVGGFARRLESPTHSFTPRALQGRWLGFSFTARDISPEEDIVLIATLPSVEREIHPILVDDHDGTWLRARIHAPPRAPEPHSSSSSPPMAALFVLDVTGSMRGERIANLRRGFADCLELLSSDDRFNVLPFSLIPRALNHEFLPVTSEHLEHARNYVDSFEALGATNLGETIQRAAELAATAPSSFERHIFLVTDGKANVGIINPARLKALWKNAAPPSTRLSVLAIGSNVDFRLLSELVRHTKGRLILVDSPDAIPEHMLELVRSGRPLFRRSSITLHTAGLPIPFHTTQETSLRGVRPLLVWARLPPGTGPSMDLTVSLSHFDHSSEKLSISNPASFVSTVEGIAESSRVAASIPAITNLVEAVHPPRDFPQVPPWKEARIRRVLRIPSGGAENAALKELEHSSGPEVRQRHAMMKDLKTWGTFLPRTRKATLHRRVGSRIFLRQLNNRWAEEPMAIEAPRSIIYASQEWQHLAVDRPDLRAILALGDHIIFRDGGRVIEIRPPSAP